MTLLDNAYSDCVLTPINYFPNNEWKPPTPSTTLAKCMDRVKLPLVKKQSDYQLNDPARDTRAQRYQDNTFFHTDTLAFNHTYEIGRFIAGPCELGIVKTAWTYAGFRNISDPGHIAQPQKWDPFTSLRPIGGASGTGIVYSLRLTQGTFQPLPPAFSGLTTDVTGYGFAELPRWIDNRFSWAEQENNVFFLVPANHALRLYCSLYGSVDDIAEIGGRLKGYTQPINVLPDAWNVHHGW